MTSVYDTWWAKVNQALQALLCVNNSYSGSKVTGAGFPSATSWERVSGLRTAKYTPDYILIYMGSNDFGNGVKVFCTHEKTEACEEIQFFETAYDILLKRVIEENPNSKIVCGTLMRTVIKDYPAWVFPEQYAGVELEAYNDAIRRVTERNHVFLADVGRSNLRYETLDGMHPTAEGHVTIANAWIDCLAEQNLITPSIETCIKMYHRNVDNPLCQDMVYHALKEERVLFPIDNSGMSYKIEYNGQKMIPVFTSPNEIAGRRFLQLKSGVLFGKRNTNWTQKTSVIINPYSQLEKRFIIPYDSIARLELTAKG